MAEHPLCQIGITDGGKNSLGLILPAVAAAVAGLNTAAAIDIANQQYNIAREYLDIAEWWRNYYNSTYAPIEDKELSEATNLAIEQPKYDMAVGRARTFARLQFKGVASKSVQCTSEYCTGLRAALLKDVVTQEAATTAAISNMGYRNERAYVEARRDVRWQRRYETVKRGRDMVANNIQFAQLAFGIFGDLGKQAGAGAAGALGFLGYNLQRRETMYPTFMRGQVKTQTVPEPRQPQQTAQATPPPQRSIITSGVVQDANGNWVQMPKEE